jgi:hypothetical protein
VRAWTTSGELTKFFFSTNNTCPTNESRVHDGTTLFLEGGTAQYAVFGVDVGAPNVEVVVSVASTVRPIHPHTAAKVIYAFYIFFGCNFVLTGVLQWWFFKTAMDPNEYKLSDK